LLLLYSGKKAEDEDDWRARETEEERKRVLKAPLKLERRTLNVE
jgi:hypothetical protein